MGMKEYVLWGGGALVVLVVAHGLWQAWRSRRQRNVARAEGEPDVDSGNAEQLDIFEPPVLNDLDDNADAVASVDAEEAGDAEVSRDAEVSAGGSASLDDAALADDVGSADAVGFVDAEEPVDPESSLNADPLVESGAPVEAATPAGAAAEGIVGAGEDATARTNDVADSPSRQREGLAPLGQEPHVADSGDDAEVGKRGRRIVIPGKRTEPTVPRNDHLFKVRTSSAPEPSRAPPAPPGLDQVVVIWVASKDDTGFGGHELVKALADNGLRYGNDALFRKFDVDSGEELFSVVNGLEPGTFDLSDLDALTTPRIVMLLSLVNATSGLAAFSEMLDAAQDISISLGGELRDENMGPMTGQTIEHYRQRISDYKRKSLRK